jgi:hypothetical protein
MTPYLARMRLITEKAQPQRIIYTCGQIKHGSLPSSHTQAFQKKSSVLKPNKMAVS